MRNKKGLIFGVTGMLGHVLFRSLAKLPGLDIYGTNRSRSSAKSYFPEELSDNIRNGVDAENLDSIHKIFGSVKPDFVINSIGITDPVFIKDHPISAIDVNSQLPHRLASLCQKNEIRFIHISTDGVFDGKKGMYKEKDACSIGDAYGMTKYLGEVSDNGCLTLRTSIIGHGITRKTGLVDWLLSQTGKVSGYSKAIYSGFPTIELARIISDFILPTEHLSGIYHVSSNPISKYDLLRLIAEKYAKDIEIEPDDNFYCDRSLIGIRFSVATGWKAPDWDEMLSGLAEEWPAYQEYYTKQ